MLACIRDLSFDDSRLLFVLGSNVISCVWFAILILVNSSNNCV